MHTDGRMVASQSRRTDSQPAIDWPGAVQSTAAMCTNQLDSSERGRIATAARSADMESDIRWPVAGAAVEQSPKQLVDWSSEGPYRNHRAIV